MASKITINQLVGKFKQIKKRQVVAEKNILKKQMLMHNSFAKKLTPVDTGNLRKMWSTKIDGKNYISFNNVEYAKFVDQVYKHKGGRFTPGKFMNKRAYDIVNMNKNKIILSEFKRIFK